MDNTADSAPPAAAAHAEPDDDRPLFPSGEALSLAAANRLLRERPARLVALVGERGSGKTTLIGALYDRFQRGEYGGFSFAGSRTLIGFDRVWYLARAAAGATADTPRTSLADGLQFYHLRLAHGGERRDLLLADRAGETYTAARGDQKLAKDLMEVARAECVLLLLDGERVANVLERTQATEAVRQSLRAFLDAGMLGKESVVCVVETKGDLLLGAHDAYLEEFWGRLVRDFGKRTGRLLRARIAARARKVEIAPALGVDSLLSLAWASDRFHVARSAEAALNLRTEFERFAQRRGRR